MKKLVTYKVGRNIKNELEKEFTKKGTKEIGLN
jgi:hypothetical protein